jgi:hypothetical protein
MMNRGGMVQPSIDQQFFSPQNETQIVAALANDVQRSGSVSLGKVEQTRLVKTVKHYMNEVWDVNGPMPIPQLNREVLNVASQDFAGYLRRQALGGRSLGASQQIVSTEQPARAEVAQQRLQIQQGVPIQPRPTFENTLLMDTGSLFEQMQQERNGGGASRPPPPKFELQLSSNTEEPSALALFETAKKAREAEATKQAPIGGEGNAETDANPLVRFMSPPSLLNDANANPTTALPVLTPAPRGPLPQDYLIKQDDIINYREVEYNLVLYSADRDWLNNASQTRYVFSVNFDPGNNKQGFYSQLTTNKKFKNITRIELVKAIIPTEGLIPLTQRVTSPSTAFVNTAKLNALTYPYIAMRIPELDVNNYGSDDVLNNSFATLQYDANWYTDNANLEDGYLAMIPKFMKCQKVYQPTPLATLQKLTIEMLTPEGQPLSTVPDTLTIQNIYFTTDNTVIANMPLGIRIPDYYNAVDANGMSEYLFIQTTTYFSKWQFAKGNRIAFQGLNSAQVPGGNTLAAQNLVNYLQNPQGLPIINIGTTGGTPVLGANSVGYANVIIVRSPHVDPTTGSVLVQPFGGSTSAMDTMGDAANAVTITTTTFTGAKLINLSHQTNVVLRVICREMDPAARVRPDNL